MIRKYIFILTAVLLLPAAAVAQEVTVVGIDNPAPEAVDGSQNARPWTLAECIAWARDNNIQILQQELYAKDAEMAVSQAKLNYIPSLSAGGNYNTTFAESLDPVSGVTQGSYSSISASASLSTDLFAGFKKLHNLRRADLSLRETLMSIEKAKNDLELNVTAAYLDILSAEERVHISQAQQETLQLQVDNSQKLVDAGKSTLGDLLQLQAQLADVKQQLLQNENQRILAYFNLCQLLEIEDFMNFRIITPEQVTIITDSAFSSTREIIEAAQALPQIEGAKLGVEIAERDIKIAKADHYPSLRFSAGYGSSYSTNQSKAIPDPNNPTGYIYEKYPFGEQIRDHASPSISLSLSIPIFNSFQTRNNVRSKRIALQRADYNMMLAQKQISKDIQQAFIDATGALEQYNSAVANVSTNEEAFRIVEQKFNLGAATPIDYSIALYNLTNSRAQLSQAKYQYVFKSKILDFYKGVPIDL